ncbi:hypothetical protein Ndes2437B_g00940 [Nannochloris sp. 'desiccata']
MAKRSTAGLVKYVKFLMEAGVMERPLWLDALERVAPPTLTKAGRRPQSIRFPEDEIVRAYYKRNPGASLEPIYLGSFEPSTARRFATRQLELMDQGISRKDARLQTQSEFKAEAAASNEKGVIATIQAEEEIHLDQAIKTYVERHGHKPLQQMNTRENYGSHGSHNNNRAQMINTAREAMRKLPAPPVKTMTSDVPAAG